MSSQVVTYQVDDSTTVSFEIEPVAGFRPAASPNEIVGKVRSAVGPAVEAAKEVLDKVKEICPDEIELTFGIKVSGGADWLIAKAAGEASFEIKLTWSPNDKAASGHPEEDPVPKLEAAEGPAEHAADPAAK